MESPTPRNPGCYAVRMTIPSVTDAFWSGILVMCEALFVVRHPTDNNHYHLAIVNASFTQDTLRKKLKDYINKYFYDYRLHLLNDGYKTMNIVDTVEAIDKLPTGQGLMTVKKWDTSPTYLTYMLKGQYEPAFNENREGTWLHPDYVALLRRQWVSRNPQQNSYMAWQASHFFPAAPTTAILNEVGEVIVPSTKTPFDTIIALARTFVMETEQTEYVNAKVRFIHKDLVSNYCLRHNIKMGPIYI